MNRTPTLMALAGVCLASLWGSAAHAADPYPNRPLRMVVGYAPGGPTDVIARLIAKGMGDTLGQSVVIDNKPGANAMIATTAVQREPADGYTLLFSPIAYTINPLISPELARYDPRTSMEPVGLVATLPLVMITAGNSPHANAGALLAAAKTKPGTVSFGSSGNGSSPHLAAALLSTATQTDMTHVSFRGNAPAMAEVMSGRVDFMFYPMVGLSSFIEQKKLKALAVGSAKEIPDMPGVPTVEQALGVKGFEHTAPWVGILAPKNTPVAVVQALNRAVQRSLESPEIRQQFKQLGAVAVGGSTQDFTRFLAEDTDRWAKVVKAAHIKGE